SSGTSLEKKTYGAWGSGTPSSYLWRGWCGHEYLDSFSLVNMNARLYDPILGRFLSPDPFIQAPDLPINFNRYAYCLNNPLKYNDPDGEFVITTTMILVTGAIIGATFGGIQGYKIGQAKGLSGWDMFGCIAAGSAIGGAAAFAGGYVATALAPVVAAAGYGGFVGGAITGAFSGAAAGAINGLGFGALSTGTLDGAFNAGAQGMALGMLSGAAMGGIMQGISAKLDGKNFWTGKEPRTTIDLSQQTVRNDSPVKIKEPTIPKASELGDFPDDIRIRYEASQVSDFDPSDLQPQLNIKRPLIKGYRPRVYTQTDLYHNYPISFDDIIIQYGAADFRLSDGAMFYYYPGTINGNSGIYTIGINSDGFVFHRCFYAK
ncbi:MAG: RHS repeat-associated core domain-containing protein, partial [Bacteroidales bacterium]|nr:RHS repeat-associated core domain-containing protein [Bacteroidales bacterium]